MENTPPTTDTPAPNKTGNSRGQKLELQIDIIRLQFEPRGATTEPAEPLGDDGEPTGATESDCLWICGFKRITVNTFYN